MMIIIIFIFTTTLPKTVQKFRINSLTNRDLRGKILSENLTIYTNKESKKMDTQQIPSSFASLKKLGGVPYAARSPSNPGIGLL